MTTIYEHDELIYTHRATEMNYRKRFEQFEFLVERNLYFRKSTELVWKKSGMKTGFKLIEERSHVGT